jgi:uncharacterized protein YecA (UPF0149 family)
MIRVSVSNGSEGDVPPDLTQLRDGHGRHDECPAASGKDPGQAARDAR